MLLGFVFAYARLLQRLTAASPGQPSTALLPDVLLAMTLAAGAFLFYPENTVVHLVMLGVGTVVWCGFTRRLPGLRAVTVFAMLFTGALVLSSLPFWEGTAGFVVKQLGPGAGQVPESWATVFRQLLAGAAGQPTGRRRVSRMPERDRQPCAGRGRNVLPDAGLCGDANRAVRMDGGHDGAGSGDDLEPGGVVVDTAFRERHGGLPGGGCHRRPAVRGLLPRARCHMERGEAAGIRCRPICSWCCAFRSLRRHRNRQHHVCAWPLVAWLSRGAAVVLVCAQFGFGAARVWTARDPLGIGYDSATYPSIQVTTMKSAMAWQVDSGTFAGVSTAYTSRAMRTGSISSYLKQKLAYARVPYFSSAHRSESEVMNGRDVGRQPSIPTDCSAVFTGGRSCALARGVRPAAVRRDD